MQIGKGGGQRPRPISRFALKRNVAGEAKIRSAKQSQIPTIRWFFFRFCFEKILIYDRY